MWNCLKYLNSYVKRAYSEDHKTDFPDALKNAFLPV